MVWSPNTDLTRGPINPRGSLSSNASGSDLDGGVPKNDNRGHIAGYDPKSLPKDGSLSDAALGVGISKGPRV